MRPSHHVIPASTLPMARPVSSKTRDLYILRLNLRLMRELGYLSVNEEIWSNELTEEAVRDVLKKYGQQCKD